MKIHEFLIHSFVYFAENDRTKCPVTSRENCISRKIHVLTPGWKIANPDWNPDWKIANVTPVFKKGSCSLAENYRPISLTSVICKILESLLCEVIITHLSEQQLLNSSQHGFVSHRSCLTNLLEYLETLTSLLDKGHNTDVFYLDFSKAFDRVPHQRLLAKLRAHGITGEIFNWIQSWLGDRKQRVNTCCAERLSI